ncbi:MAG TPA: YbhN family protein [Acidimicrobiales bacterium]|nr:YbhN family protein [Acidimicrobiales bacterium]
MGTRPEGAARAPVDPVVEGLATVEGLAAELASGGDVAAAGAVRRRRLPRWVVRAWPAVRVLIGFALVGAAVWVLSSKGSELSGFTSVFKTLNWWWVPPAFAAEVASYACFALMQRQLLLAGHLRPPWWTLFKLTFGSQALTNSLPVGNALATVYGFRWFRRFGADNTLAVWALAGTLVASLVSLSLVAVIGLAMATGAGASFDLVPVLIGVFAIALAIGSLFVYERPLHWVVSAALRVSVAVTGRPRGDTHEQIGRMMAWTTAVRLSWTETGRIVVWGTVNWLLDCACFAMMFLAIHAPIPWAGLLLAYGAGQLAATLPITPGGLGVVEGSITVALVAFGGAETSTAYAVLLYRIISFWFILLVGWSLIGEMALEVRRGRWRRSAMTSVVEAGPVAYAPGVAGAGDAGEAVSGEAAGQPAGEGLAT